MSDIVNQNKYLACATIIAALFNSNKPFEEAYYNIVNSVDNAKISIVSNRGEKISRYWWSEDLADLRNRYKSAQKKYRYRCKHEKEDEPLFREEFKVYKTAKAAYYKAIKAAKAKAWRKIILGIQKNPWGKYSSNVTIQMQILCLHGYRQNGPKFSSQTGALRKMLKNEAEFYFLSAPHIIPYTETEGDEEEQRAWWFTTPTGFSSRDETDLDKGLQESLTEIEKIFKEKGPFQGILGFSQGAALTGLLCAFKERNEIELDFRFVIIVSGFKSRCTLHKKYYEGKININSLHVIGETDQIISNDMSYGLADVFVNPVILMHPGGHFVPGKSSLKKGYMDFLTAQRSV